MKFKIAKGGAIIMQLPPYSQKKMMSTHHRNPRPTSIPQTGTSATSTCLPAFSRLIAEATTSPSSR